MIKEEVVYLFLKDGKPEVKFSSIKAPSHTTTEGLKELLYLLLRELECQNFIQNCMVLTLTEQRETLAVIKFSYTIT